MHLHPRIFSQFLLVGACVGGCSMATGGRLDDTGESSTSTDPTNDPTNDPTSDPTAAPTTGEEPTGSGATGDGDDTCGDGRIDGDELCDGADLGGTQCADVDAAFIGGVLACAGDCGSFDASGCEVAADAALVALNEVTSKGATAGPYADLGDAIEIVNVGAAAADLSGWQLSDDPSLPADKTYVFPPGTSLAPGALLVLVAYDEVTMTGELPFGVSDDKEETLTLTNAAGVGMDVVTFNGADAAVSYCRLPDGTGAWQTCAQTFGETNVEASAACGDGVLAEAEDCDGAELGGQTCEGLGLGFTGGSLACSRSCTFDASMCVSGSTVALNELESTDDRIELYNASNQPVDLSGWILTDDVVDQDYDPAADPEKLVFSPQTTLGAKQFLVVAKGDGPGEHVFGLGAAGDTVSLLQPNLTVVDQVSYAADEATTSYCRLPDGPGGEWTVDCTPSFGAANQGP